MIKVVELSKSFSNRKLFSSFSYEFKNIGMYFLLGESGSGKSTLLNILSGLDQNYLGAVYFKNNNIKNLNILDLRKNNFSFIFQSFNLFENDTVFNNLLLVINSKNKEEIENKIYKVLKELDILSLKDMYVKNLSGGEKQRVCIARSLLTDPDVIFADEPTGSLDSNNAINIFEILKEISKTRLVIVVSHDEGIATNYANYILKIVDHKVIEIKKGKIKDKVILKNKNNKEKSRISLRFISQHIKNNIKSKRLRFIITNLFFSFSLLVLGLSLLINFTLRDNLVSSFDSLMGNESLVLKRKDDDVELKEFYGASKSEVDEISKKYKEDIEYVGVNYLVDFENFFIDENELYNVTKTPISKMEGFNIRHFNEFIFVNNIEDLEIGLNQSLKDDEIILGMNYPSMKALCSSLFIEKTYEILNEFLKTNKVLVSLYLKNESRNYSDEQVFVLKGVTKSVRPEVYHTNPLFNEILFENNMRFPSSLEINKTFELPRIMKKVYYISLKDHQSIFLDKIFLDKDYDNYLFENDSITYSPLNYTKESRKQYVFSIFGKFFNRKILTYLSSYIDVNNYYYSTNGGYINYGNSLFSGFSNSLFIGKDKDKVEQFVDNYLSLSVEKRNNVVIDEDLAFGDSLSLNGDNVKFTSLKENLIKGENPKFLDEIGISSFLANKINLDIGDEAYFVLVNPDFYKNDRENQFKTIKLTIGGIYENNSPLLYHLPNFSIKLFRDLFKISSFNLIINSIVIESSNKYKESYINKLNNLLDEYEFVNMLSYVKESISSTLNILEYILLFISLFVMIFALLILITINFINFEESKKEIATFLILGYDEKEVNKVYFLQNLNLVFSSMIESVFGTIIMSLLTCYITSKQLNVALIYSFPLIPVGFIIIITFIILLVLYPLLLKSIKRLEVVKSMHN